MSTTRLISLPFYCCLIIIIFLLLIDIVNGRWCYWIDGTDAKDRNPCLDLNTVGASMCCDGALAASFVKCIGGICVYNFSSGIPGLYDDGRSFWRDSCTDPRWQDPACLAMAPCMQKFYVVYPSSVYSLSKSLKKRGGEPACVWKKG